MPPPPSPSLEAAERALLADDLAAALPLLQALAGGQAPPPAVHYYLGLCHQAEGRLEQAAAAFDRCGLFPPTPSRKFREFGRYAAWQADFAARQRAAIARGLPFFCLTAVPQSASAALCEELSRLTGCPIANPIVGTPYASAPDWAAACWIAGAARGGLISHSHFAAEPRTLERLRAGGVERILVQVRDPRQAIYSRCAAHLEKRRKRPSNADVSDPRKQAFLALDGEALLQAMYRDLLPRYWSWLRGWMTAAQAAGAPAVKSVDFAEVTRETDRVVEQTLAFFGVDPGTFLPADWNAGRRFEAHFRKGELAEWASTASSETRALVDSLTDDEVLAFHGWPRDPRD